MLKGIPARLVRGALSLIAIICGAALIRAVFGVGEVASRVGKAFAGSDRLVALELRRGGAAQQSREQKCSKHGPDSPG